MRSNRRRNGWFDDPRRRLPDETLIGRSADVQALQDHLTGDEPVVLLTGPAGVGKSAVAESVAESWTEGPVFICELEDAGDDGQLVKAVAAGFDCAATDEAILAALEANSGTLLVLDDADSTLEILAERLGVWRGTAPTSRVLLTARRRIPMNGAVHMELAALSESEAVALFESRARRARPGFQVPGAKTPVIRDVVERLDRMPEAIGLAADRMQVLSLDALDQRLAEPRIAIGAGSDPRGPMRKAFDSTWKSLDEPARLTLQRCAVFAGPFDAAAAEAIVLLPPDGPSVPTALATLKDHSLVSTEASEGTLRFWMLDAIRQFAWGALESSGEQAEVRARFITWYAALAGHLSHTGERDEVLTELDGAWDNLMEAATWSMETRPGEAATILAAIAPLVGFWRPIGPFLEVAQDADLDADGRGDLQASLALALAQAAWRRGRAHDASHLLDDALRTPNIGDSVATALLIERAMLAHRQGVAQQSDADLEDALETAGDDRRMKGRLSLAMAARAFSAGALDEARAHATDAAVLFEDDRDRRGAAQAAVALGRITLAQGELDGAQAQLEHALAQFQRIGDKGSEITARLELGRLAMAQGGDAIVATGQLRAALDGAVALGDLEIAGQCHAALGLLALENGDERTAEEQIEGAAYAHRRTSREGAAVALGLMGLLETRRGRLGMAERRLSDATKSLEALGAWRRLAAFRSYEAWVLLARGETDRAREVLDTIQGPLDVDGEATTRWVRALADGKPLAPDAVTGVHGRLIALFSQELAGPARDGDGTRFVHVEREGRWFQVDDGPLAELGHRKPMRRILLGLAAAREQNAGMGMATEAIFEAGWPGERATPESARNRVYVTIRRLRSAGLEDVLLSDDTGYFLDPEVQVRWTPGRG